MKFYNIICVYHYSLKKDSKTRQYQETHGMWDSALLPILPVPLWFALFVPVRVPSMGLTDIYAFFYLLGGFYGLWTLMDCYMPSHVYTYIQKCLWCCDYCRRKWTRWDEFGSKTRQLAWFVLIDNQFYNPPPIVDWKRRCIWDLVFIKLVQMGYSSIWPMYRTMSSPKTPFFVYWPTTRPRCQNSKCTRVNNRWIRSRNSKV